MGELSMEEMWELQRETLTNLRTRVIRDLEPRKYLSHLREKRVFDEDDTDLIRSKATRKERGEVFLDIVTRHPDGFSAFCQALWDGRTQGHIADELSREFQSLKQRYIENKGSPSSSCHIHRVLRLTCSLGARRAVEEAAVEREERLGLEAS